MSHQGERAPAAVSVFIDTDVWVDEVHRFRDASKAFVAAQAARRVIDRRGLPRDALAACEAKGSDGTRLGGCVKARVPLGEVPSVSPWGFVFQPFRAADGTVAIRLLAFGERHPREPATRSVYARAHHRLHGRWPA